MSETQISRKSLQSLDFVIVPDGFAEVARAIQSAANDFRSASQSAQREAEQAMGKVTAGGWMPVTTYFEQQQSKYVALQTIVTLARSMDLAANLIARASQAGVMIFAESEITE